MVAAHIGAAQRAEASVAYHERSASELADRLRATTSNLLEERGKVQAYASEIHELRASLRLAAMVEEQNAAIETEARDAASEVRASMKRARGE